MTHELIIFDHIYTPLASKGRVAGLREFKEMENAFKNGQAVYVQFVADQGIHRKRLGSIARVTGIRSSQFNYVSFELDVTWDGRKNTTRCTNYVVGWLKGYDGPTNWIWTEDVDKRPNITDVFDRLGEKLEVGQFVSFAFNTSGTLDLMFGKITRITDKGDVYVLNQRMGEKDMVTKSGYTIYAPVLKERLIKEPQSQLMVLTKDLMDRMLLMKLAK